MSLFSVLATLIALAALFSYLNHRYLSLPTTIGVMLIALVASLVLIVLNQFGVGLEAYADRLLSSIDFSQALLQGMLSFLLFAAALHIDLGELLQRRRVIAALSTVGVVLSSLLVGFATYFIFGFFGFDIGLIYCLLFGTLISPTDPIAVMGILKTAGAPKSLEMKIAGESLFNDGVGVVLFLVVLEVAVGGHVTVGHAVGLFATEAIGGAVFGFVAGYVAYRMLRRIDDYQVEVMITLALVMGCYALAGALHLSGPIAIVIAGLLIGNSGRRLAMSDTTRERLDIFWELVDEILNAVLFVLIGLELLVITLEGSYVLAGALLIPIVLVARLIAVGIPISILRPFSTFSPGAVRIMTWGGLRGGISVALALSIPPGPERSVILTITYVIVVFSILVQGLTVGPVVRRLVAGKSSAELGEEAPPVMGSEGV